MHVLIDFVSQIPKLSYFHASLVYRLVFWCGNQRCTGAGVSE